MPGAVGSDAPGSDAPGSDAPGSDAGGARAAIVGRIRRAGPIPFSQYLDLCLYGPGGFYATGGGAGRRSDFLTSPEVGGLFGAVVARVIDAEWERCGRPDPWLVIEAAAGSGSLAVAVLAAGPTCAPALRYVGVEVSDRLRLMAADRLPVELPALVVGPGKPQPTDGEDGSESSPVAGRGPLVTFLADLPAQPFTGMIIANELLDNLAFDLFEHRDGHWWEVRVGEVDGALVEVPVAAAPAEETEASRLAPDGRPGGRLALQHGAGAWLARSLGHVERGRIICVDYCVETTAAMVERPQREWLRTYRRHGHGAGPLEVPGEQDVTCEVAIDQLASVRWPTSDRSQSEWLEAHGLAELVDRARQRWRAAAARPDLAALAARSRVAEAGALIDPDGLGAFRVLEWEID